LSGREISWGVSCGKVSWHGPATFAEENHRFLKLTVWAVAWSDHCAELCDENRIRRRNRTTPPRFARATRQFKREDTTPKRLVALAISWAAYTPLDVYQVLDPI
jgi:hypothetical protein